MGPILTIILCGRYQSSECAAVMISIYSNDDEIIECDGCGILVHEGCYGTIEEDIQSDQSELSTESTEPWFCDSCKAGVIPVSL